MISFIMIYNQSSLWLCSTRSKQEAEVERFQKALNYVVYVLTIPKSTSTQFSIKSIKKKAAKASFVGTRTEKDQNFKLDINSELI